MTVSKKNSLGTALFSFVWLAVATHSFQIPPRAYPLSTTQLFCICINCSRVTDCKAYHFVETKHEQPHMNENPTFTPSEGSPTIHVNVRTTRDEQEIARMWSEHKGETRRAEEKARGEDQDLHGETVYDFSPKMTVEYDVVACEDFIQDVGCWVRNMPEEIRKANPDFVPT